MGFFKFLLARLSSSSPPFIISSQSFDEHDNTFWRLPNGQCHREDGPAIERADGTKEWWRNDERHREDGPAIEYADGTKAWYLYGEEFTEAEFNQWREELHHALMPPGIK